MRLAKAKRLLVKAAEATNRGEYEEAKTKLGRVIDAGLKDVATLALLSDLVVMVEQPTGQEWRLADVLDQVRNVDPVGGRLIAASAHMMPLPYRPGLVDAQAAARELDEAERLIAATAPPHTHVALQLLLDSQRAAIAAQTGQHAQAWELIDGINRRAAEVGEVGEVVPPTVEILEHRDGQPMPRLPGPEGPSHVLPTSVAHETIRSLRSMGWTGVRPSAPAPAGPANGRRETPRSPAPTTTPPTGPDLYAQSGMDRAGFARPSWDRPGVTHSVVLSDGRLVTRSPSAIAVQDTYDAQPRALATANEVSSLLELGGELAAVADDTLIVWTADGGVETLSEAGAMTAAAAAGDRIAVLTSTSGLQRGTYDQAGQIHLAFMAMATGARQSLLTIVGRDLVALSFLSMVTVHDGALAGMAMTPNGHVAPRHTLSVPGSARAMTASGERYLAIGDEGGGVSLYDLADAGAQTPLPVFTQTLHDGPVGTLITLPSGEIVSGGIDGQVFLIQPDARTAEGPVVTLDDPIIGGGTANGLLFVRCPFHWVPLTT